jgi:hypothetical protein
MTYVVNNTRGQIIAVVPDGTVDITSTSQSLVGKNVTPYGEYEVENLVHQLENFANSTPPGNPIEGQLWYNTTQEQMYAFSGEEWKTVSGMTVSTTTPTLDPRVGDLWFNPDTYTTQIYSTLPSGYGWISLNTVTAADSAPSATVAGELYFNILTNQLFAYDGTDWNLIGPDAVSGFGVTRWISTSMPDESSTQHAVLQGVVNGSVIAIISVDTFTIATGSRPTGFVNLVSGINIPAGNLFNGTANAATQLATTRYINGVAFNGTANITIGSEGTLTAGGYLTGGSYNGTNSVIMAVNATSTNTPSTVVARSSSGDFSAGTVFANLVGTVTGTATNVSGLVAVANGGTGQPTYNPGELLIGTSAGGLNRGTLTGDGSISVSYSPSGLALSYIGGTGTGNVNSVGIAPVGEGLSITGSPITSSGTMYITNTGVTRITQGLGISVNQVNGNVTVTNSGVRGLTGGDGILVSGATGNVTIANSGVTKIIAGTNISISPSGGFGEVTISASGGGGSAYTLPTASSSTLGGVKVGSGLSINAGVLSASGVNQIIAGSGVSISPVGGTGAVTISANPGSYSLPIASGSVLGGVKIGSGLSINPSTGVLSATAGGGSGTVTSITAGAGLTGGTISTAGTIAVDSSVLRSNVAQSITALKTFTGGVISQAYNLTNAGSSIFYVYETEPVVKIPVNDGPGPYDYTHQFYNKRLVVEGSADRPPGSNRPAGGAIMGIDNGTSGGGGVFGHHTNNVPGIGIGVGAFASNMTFTGAVFQGISSRPSSADFVQIRSYSLLDVVFEVRGNGNVFYAGSVTAPGSDYAEYFEWADGNPNAEDRVGYTVSLDGNKIKLAEPGEHIVGVVSAVPAVLGDGAELGWKDQYLRDDWGRVLTEEYHAYDWTDEDGKKHSVANFEDLSNVPSNAVITSTDGFGNPLTRPRLNPAYDKTATYIPRSKRPEWAPIGLVGKLKVRKGQITGTGWIKLRDIAQNIEEWLVK